MKKAAGLVAFLVLLLQVGGAFAQSSDFEIIETFKSRHKSLLVSLKGVQELGQRDNLESEIARLEAEYAPHQKLLGEGLYPESFAAAIVTLRDQLKKTTERLLLAEESKKDKVAIAEKTRKIEAQDATIKVISTQNEEYRAALEKMTREVQELSARIQKLSEENAALQGSIKALQLESRKDKESIAKLKELTERLQANIRDRDELIVKMMDSLFDEYSKADLTDAQKKDILAIAQKNDYVSKIVTTVDGNINYVGTALLTPQDVNVIRDQQKRLALKWEGIKPFVSKLYPDETSRSRDISMVDGRLSDLKRGTGEATWRSIQQVFSANGIALAPFRNAGEFSTLVLAYIDEQLKNTSREKYQLFKNKVWDSPIKDQWLPVIPLDELTAQQRSDIDARIALWDKKISAQLWRWVLIGIFGAALVAVIAFLVRRKKNPALPV
jgi:myosin heavy subunit